MLRRVRRFLYLARCLGWSLAVEQTEQEILFDGLQRTLEIERATHQADRPRPVSRRDSVARAL